MKQIWNDPRSQIQFTYKNNDMGYTFHGNFIANLILHFIDKKPSELENKSFLDYGGGTGAIGRSLSLTFDKVVTYDPSPECIQVGLKENGNCEKLKYSNYKITNNLDEVKKQKYDYINTINVFEHLTEEEIDFAMTNIDACLKDDGEAFIFYNRKKEVNIKALSKWIKDKDLTCFDPRFKGYYNNLSIEEINKSDSNICMNVYTKNKVYVENDLSSVLSMDSLIYSKEQIRKEIENDL